MKTSFKTILVFSFSVIILFSISLVIFSSYYTTKLSMKEQSSKIMENISSFAIDKSINYMDMATNAAILTKNLQKKSVINTSQVNKVIDYFYEQMVLNPHFSAIYYATTEGDFIMLLKSKDGYLKKYITYNSSGDKVVKNVYTNRLFVVEKTKEDNNDKYDPRIRPWFVDAVENKKLIWTEPYVFYTSKKPGITTATPIYNEAKYIQGVIGIDIEIDELSTFINSLKISDNGRVFLMDKSLKMITLPVLHNNKENYRLKTLSSLDDNSIIKSAFRKFEKNNSLENLEDKVLFNFNTQNKDYQGMFVPLNIGELEWFIGMYALEDDFLGLLKKNQKLNFIFIIIIALITIFISIKIANQIFNPISKLRDMTDELKLLNLNQPTMEPSKINEINQLINSFDKMKKNLKKAYLDTMYRLAVASEYKDTSTSEHINRIGLFCELIAKKLNLKEEDIYTLKHASAMHDIGKLGIPDNILLKEGELTNEEREVIKTHPEIGANILKNPTSKIMKAGQIISLYHHERWDGAGYPRGLKGNEIPLHARIVAIVDVFDALISERCYKKAYSKEKTLEIIMSAKGKAFDPEVTDAFYECYDELICIYKESGENTKSES